MLSRQEIDRIVDTLTMGDVQAAFREGHDERTVGGAAFARAAKRSGLVNGGDPLDAVGLGDVTYLAGKISEVMSDANPKLPTIGDSPPSAASGG